MLVTDRLGPLHPLAQPPGDRAGALAEGEIGFEEAWVASTLDEAWQLEQWGADSEAEKMLEARHRDFEAAYRFLQLL